MSTLDLRKSAPDLLLGLSLVALCLGVYGSLLTGFFSGTDTFSLIETGSVQTLRDVAQILGRPLMAGTGFTSIARYFRPVSSLSFGMDYALWGLNPAGFFLTNLLLHTTNSLLLFYLLGVQGNLMRFPAWMGATVFMLHPVMVDVVPVISRRQDMLALSLGLLALIAYRQKIRRIPRGQVLGVLSVGLFALAVLAKEIAAVFLLLILADRLLIQAGERWPTKNGLAQVIRDSIPYIVALGLLLVWRVIVLEGMGGELGHGGLLDAGSAPRSLAIVAAFWQELADPRGLLTNASRAPGWLGALLMATLAFVGAAWMIGRTAGRVEGSHGRDRSQARQARAGSFAVTLLLAAGTMLVGLSAWWLTRAPSPLQSSPAPAGVLDTPQDVKAAGMVIGVGLAGLVAWIVATARRENPERGNLGEWGRRLAYYSLWIALPLSIYVMTGTFSARLNYLPAAGMAALIALFIDGIGRPFLVPVPTPFDRIQRIVVAGLAPTALLLTGCMLSSSPAVSGMGEWPAKARLAAVFLREFEQDIGAQGACPEIVIHGLPDRGAIGLDEYGVQSWLRLRYPDWSSHAYLEDRAVLTTIPETLLLEAGECSSGRLEAWVQVP